MGIGTVLAVSATIEFPISGHQVRPELHRHTQIDDTGRTEDQNVIAVDGKRPPGLNLARTRLSDLRIIE